MFTVLAGQVEVTFRCDTLTARAGETINVPANSPHSFRNAGDVPARLLCLCAPAGQDYFSPSSASPSRPAPGDPASGCRGAAGVHRQVDVTVFAIPHRALASPRRGRRGVGVSFTLGPEVTAVHGGDVRDVGADARACARR